mgnify:CR=1 FL=1
MSRDFRLYIADLIQSCDRITEYVGGSTFESFSNDSMLIDAVARNLEIIGEAVKNIPADTLQLRPEINWSDVARFRDVIAHQYFRVKLTVVWDTIQHELDSIRTAASKMLDAFPPIEID